MMLTGENGWAVGGTDGSDVIAGVVVVATAKVDNYLYRTEDDGSELRVYPGTEATLFRITAAGSRLDYARMHADGSVHVVCGTGHGVAAAFDPWMDGIAVLVALREL